MGNYRKVYIAVYCESDEEQQQAQRVAEDLSKTFRLSAKDLIAIHPLTVKNGQLIGNAIRTISREGVSGIAKMLPQLKKMRR